MDKKIYILDFSDKEERRFVFTTTNYESHAKKHAQLRDKTYLKEIKKILLNPDVDLIYPAYKYPNRYCYYEKLSELCGRKWYDLIVVQKRGRVYEIVSAFRFEGEIKELKYGLKSLCKKP
jgi:hypothetical protein